MKRVLTYLAILLLAIQVSPVHAIDPGEILSDPMLESRARPVRRLRIIRIAG